MRDPHREFNFADPPKVLVFGAGIAGLSVAHELAERGFKVHVYEPEKSLTEEYACRVGGMAANQLARVPIERRDHESLFEECEPKSEGGTELAATRIPSFLDVQSRLPMRPAQKCFPVTHSIRFKRSDNRTSWLITKDEHRRTNKTKLYEVFSILEEAYAEYFKDKKSAARRLGLTEETDDDKKANDLFTLRIRVLGYTDTDETPEKNRRKSKEWAEWVIVQLLVINKEHKLHPRIPDLDKRLHAQGRGAEAPLGDQQKCSNRERSNRVEFEIVEQRLPGEHGYRFFPGFYRHLFDTMKRTPVFDADGDLTQETAYNQLVSTPDPSIGFWDKEALIPVKMRRFTTLRDLQEIIEFFKNKAKFSDLDLLRLQTCFLKYMTSCKARRASEAEDVSFWQYIGADRAKYSDAAQRFIDGAPQALVAMSAKETDARTQYNTVIQMLVTNPLEELVPDMTLNASTSEAWLARWKEYLKRKHVQFFTGHLKNFSRPPKGGFIPAVAGPGPNDCPIPEYDNTDFTPDYCNTDFKAGDYKYFVLAVSFDKASELVWGAWNLLSDKEKENSKEFLAGPFQQLIDFDVITGRRKKDGTPRPDPIHDPVTGRRTNTQDPLRDISGIQYFMPVNYRFGRGHVYYANSPWGLTSISQLAFWRNRVNPIGKYVGQASFDIGDWHTPCRQGEYTAWNSTRQEIAEETWEQAKKAIEKRHADSLVPPQYYHLDQGLKFAKRTRARNFATGIVHEKMTAAFRASAIVKINGPSFGEKCAITLTGENWKRDPVKLSHTAEFIPEEGKKQEDVAHVRHKLFEAIKALGIAAAREPDDDKILISPVVSTSHAVMTITGKSDGHFEILLEGRPFIVNGRNKDEMSVAKELFDKIRSDRSLGLNVTMHHDTTITLSSTMPPDPHGADRFTVAVCNPDNHIALLGSSRFELTLDAPVDPQNDRPMAEILRQSLEDELIVDNETPYIINVPGQWPHRPGNLVDEGGNIDICYGSRKGSLFERWIPAGTYMATYTRLTTMEAANESARHAVNAILQKGLQEQDGHLMGDLCDIWDPEDCEPPDLASLKELDEALMREGLPHILDIFKVIEFLESLPDDASITEALERVRTLIENQYGLVTAAPLVGLDALESAIRIQMDAMHAILSGGVSGRGY